MAFASSFAERKYLEDGVAQNVRNDGRANLDIRHFVLETGIISQTNGSARLKLDNTDVLVGIKLETTEPDPHTPNEGKVHFSVECCPSASPEFEGKGSESLNNELARMLERMLKDSNAIDFTKLCIVPGKICWIIYIDAMVLDSGGNLFDAISVATRAALYNTRIPEVIVSNDEFEVNDDPERYVRINTENVPICVTFCKIGTGYVVDATIEEELCMSVRVTFGINKKGNLCSTQKGGAGGLDPSLTFEMMNNAKKIGQGIIEKLDHMLKLEEQTHQKKLGFFAS